MSEIEAPHDAQQPERPTLKTIAFMTGLGVTTVSRALKDAPDISLETRKRVQLVARQVGYRPNRAGIRLRTGKTNVIALILDTQETVGGFISQIVYGVADTLAETPYHLIIAPYNRDQDSMAPVRYIYETGSADGVIMSRTEPNDPRVRFLSERGFPFATHGRTAMGIDHAFHDFDNEAFAFGATQRLISAGRRRLALLGPSPNLNYHGHLRQGFQRAISEGGASELFFAETTVEDSMERVRSATMRLMAQPGRPDGIISSSEGATLAIAAGVAASGLQVGRDVDIVSKQSFKLLQISHPDIYAVDEDFRVAGHAVARAVLGAIKGLPVSDLQSIALPSF